MSGGHGTSVAVIAVLAALGLAGCGDDSGAENESIAAIDLTLDQISSVTFTADGRSARFDERDGAFVPGPGATTEFATVLGLSDSVFPVNAYRILTEVDAGQPAYGLVAATAPAGARPAVCGSGCSMEVVGDDGETHVLRVGGRTFNGAGYYASVEGDPRVFLLISQTVADIVTYARGAPFTFPLSAQVASVDERLFEAGERASGRGAPAYHPYLRQVLAAEQAAEAAEAGRPSNALVEAATSVEGQLGADQAGADQAGADQDGGQGAEPEPGAGPAPGDSSGTDG